MNGKNLVLLLVFSAILLAGCVNTGDGTPPAGSGDASGGTTGEGTGMATAIATNLKTEGIDVSEAIVDGSTVTVTYNQTLSDDPEQVYATWAYIFGTALNNAADPTQVETLAIICSFEDGEKMKISTTPETVKAFFNEEIDAWDFLYQLDFEPLTKGPQIWTGE